MTAISVSQPDGEIVITDGGEATVYPVTAGTVDVPDEAVPDFLANVPGAAVAPVPAKAVATPDE